MPEWSNGTRSKRVSLVLAGVRILFPASLKNMEIKLGKYRHYKGNEYEVIGVAIHSETSEKLVIYKALEGNGKIFVRPLKMFIEKVIVEGIEVPRFKYINE